MLQLEYRNEEEQIRKMSDTYLVVSLEYTGRRAIHGESKDKEVAKRGSGNFGIRFAIRSESLVRMDSVHISHSSVIPCR